MSGRTDDKHATASRIAKVVALAGMLAFAGPLAAQTESRPMRFDHLSLDEGLSQSTVTAILQDADGLMWFGTENGLNSYNGYEFEHFRRERGNPEALANDFIYALDQDAQGNVWVATNGGGLARMDRGTRQFETYRHDPEDAASISGNVVRTVLVDTAGRVWSGTRGSGVSMLDPSTGGFTHYSFRENESLSADADDIYALYEDSAGFVWVGTNQGLIRVDPATGAVTAYRSNEVRDAALSENRVRALYEDSTGYLWVGTYGGGLNRLDRNTGAFTHFGHDAADPASIGSDRITAIFEDEENRLWVGTIEGLNLLHRETGEFARYRSDDRDSASLSGDAISAIYQDRSGILWVGTQTRGLSKWNPRTWYYGLEDARELTDSGESQPNVTAFSVDDQGLLWIGTFGDGLHAIDRSEDTIVRYRHDPADPASLSDDRVMSLLHDRDGRLWVGTMTGGINILDTATGENTILRHDPSDPASLGADGIMALFEDSRGTVWVGTFGGGVSRYDRETGRFTRLQFDANNPAALSSNRVTSFAEDASGRLWVGTDAGGLNLLDPEAGTFTQFRGDIDDPRALSDDTVYSLHVDAEGTVWVGTRGGGLDRVVGDAADPESIEFANLSQSDGLANDVIYGIEEDASGRLWLSTNWGISSLDPSSGDIRNIHRRDGLQSEEFNFGAHFKSADGELFFGGHRGYNAFSPEELAANNRVPPIMLTGLFGANGPMKNSLFGIEDQNLEIGYKEDVLSFEFAALDFASPEHNRYMYKLEGLDHDWVDLGNRRRVTFTDLDDGHYLLRVKAANSDGVWNEAGFTLPLRVTPAPWGTWWAYLGYLAMVVQIGVALWWSYRRKLEREAEYSRRLEHEVAKRTEELRDRNDELWNLNKSLQESSLSDPLTGLRNRRFVFDEISRDLETVRRRHTDKVQGIDIDSESEMIFMMIDLDNFKPINDTFGHAAGDQVLLEVRDVLLGVCRKSHFLIRWGGDEFVVIAKAVHRHECEALAERIRSSIADHLFRLADGQIVRTTCSIGFAAYPLFRNGTDDTSLDQVINLADSLMYESKRNRNAWAGMLSVSQVSMSDGFDTDAIEPTSLLFRAQRRGGLVKHWPGALDEARESLGAAG